jgi:hypothetical protein
MDTRISSQAHVVFILFARVIGFSVGGQDASSDGEREGMGMNLDRTLDYRLHHPQLFFLICK